MRRGQGGFERLSRMRGHRQSECPAFLTIVFTPENGLCDRGRIVRTLRGLALPGNDQRCVGYTCPVPAKRDPHPVEWGSQSVPGPGGSQLGGIGDPRKCDAVSDCRGIAPDCQWRVVTVAFGRRVGVDRTIGSNRVDPATIERLGLPGQKSRARRVRQGRCRAQDLDRPPSRLDPVNANPAARFHQEPWRLER